MLESEALIASPKKYRAFSEEVTQNTFSPLQHITLILNRVFRTAEHFPRTSSLLEKVQLEL